MKFIGNIQAKLMKLSMVAAIATWSSSARATGFADMFNNLKMQIQTFSQLFMEGVTMIGAVVLAYGIYKAWDASKEGSRTEMKEVLVPMIVGGMFLAFGIIMQMAAGTASGSNAVGNSGGLQIN